MNFNHIFKKSIATAVLCFFSFTIFAQVYSNKESSRFSFTLGMTSSNLIKDTISHKSGILCNAGFSETVVLSDRLNIGLELLYTGKAFKDEERIVKYRYFYLDVPLYLQYKASESIRFNLGAQFSQFINSKILVIDGGATNGINIKPYNNIKPVDYSFLAGAEIDLNDNIALAARYTISTSTFFEKKGTNFGVFQFSVNLAIYRSHKQLFNRNKEKE